MAAMSAGGLRRLWSGLAALGAIAGLSCPASAQGNLSRTIVTTDSVEISLTLDRSVYQVGDPLQLELTVTNRSGTVVNLPFSSGQRYEFLILDQEGHEIWRWGAGMGFIQVLGEERLDPGGAVTYRERFEGRLSPGRYTVVGILTTMERPLRTSVTVTVRSEE